MSLCESFNFSEGGIWVAKTTFSLERLYYGRIFLTEFGGNISFPSFLPVSFFLGQGENTTGKNSTETSSELNEN